MKLIALRMLTADRAKYLGLVFAIAFCTFLLQNQTSIFAGIMQRTGSQIADVTDASVWVMDPKTEYFEQTEPLKETDLLRVRGVPGVAWAVRLFKGNPVAKTATGRFAVSFMIGVDDATLVGAPRRMLLGRWEDLRRPDSVVIDRAGYRLLYPGEPERLGRTVELNDHRVTIVGISDAAAPFVSWPVMHARYSEAIRFQGEERRQLSYVLAQPVRGVTPDELCARIERATALRARTTDEFRWDCIRYHLKNTGIPVNFGITIAIALVVGTVVAGQTFYLFAAQRARRDAAEAAYRATVLRALEDVENVLAARERDRRERERLAAAVASEERAVGLAQACYRAGLDSFLGVLDAQRTLRDGEDRLAAAETRTAVSAISLFKALGGGVECETSSK